VRSCRSQGASPPNELLAVICSGRTVPRHESAGRKLGGAQRLLLQATTSRPPLDTCSIQTSAQRSAAHCVAGLRFVLAVRNGAQRVPRKRGIGAPQSRGLCSDSWRRPGIAAPPSRRPYSVSWPRRTSNTTWRSTRTSWRQAFACLWAAGHLYVRPHRWTSTP
jgi:hypothetical protein